MTVALLILAVPVLCAVLVAALVPIVALLRDEAEWGSTSRSDERYGDVGTELAGSR